MGDTALGIALGLSLMNAFEWASVEWRSWVVAVALAVVSVVRGIQQRRSRTLRSSSPGV